MADSNDIRTDIPPTGQATTLAVRENFAAVKAAVKNGEDEIVRVDGAAAAETTRVNSALDGKAQRAGDLGGTTSSTTVTQIQGRPVANTLPTAGQSLTWQSNQWMPVTGGAGLTDAPLDGHLYGRVNGQWVKVSEFTGTFPGTLWSPRLQAEANNWYSVTWNGVMFVAVANSGTHRVMTSPDGVSWSSRSAVAGDTTWFNVVAGGSGFMALGNGGTNQVMTSTDGITWTARTNPGGQNNNVLGYGNGMWMIGQQAQAGGDRILTSTDNGVTWTRRTLTGGTSPNAPVWGVAYGAGRWVVSSQSGIRNSVDGMTGWADSGLGSLQGGVAAYGGGTFVVLTYVGTSSAKSDIWTSTDGQTFTHHTVTDHPWSSLAYGSNDVWVAVARDGAVMTSDDQGNTWVLRNAAEPNSWNGVTFGNNRFVAVSSDGTNRVMTSP